MHHDMMNQRIRESFARQTAMTTIGASITSVTPGSIVIDLPNAPHILQQNKFVHGGVIGMIADSACGYSALTMIPEGFTVLTSEYKINLLAPAVGERFEAVGKVIRAGRRVSVVQGDVYAIANGKRKHIAMMLATMMSIEKTPDLVD